MDRSKEPRTPHRSPSEIPAPWDLADSYRELQRLRKEVRDLEEKLGLSSNSSTEDGHRRSTIDH
jgi:hypothetical protein